MSNFIFSPAGSVKGNPGSPESRIRKLPPEPSLAFTLWADAKNGKVKMLIASRNFFMKNIFASIVNIFFQKVSD
jgi:hypothetical protein